MHDAPVRMSAPGRKRRGVAPAMASASTCRPPASGQAAFGRPRSRRLCARFGHRLLAPDFLKADNAPHALLIWLGGNQTLGGGASSRNNRLQGYSAANSRGGGDKGNLRGGNLSS